MPGQVSLYDVWIVESNSVYRGVPFTVVTDWIQEGRLLEKDQVRSADDKSWKPLEEVPPLAAYLPRAEPHPANDQAEALESVQVGFSRPPRVSDDDEDVDMIPLIDVSLVLLIFFMMTATVTSAAGLIRTPVADYGNEIGGDQGMVWIGIEPGADGTPLYALGQGQQVPLEEDRLLTQLGLLQRLDAVLRDQGPADVLIKADENTPEKILKQLRAQLEIRRARGLIRSVKDGVREGSQP
jgi:biopolymer transport protein ExbD